jgi:hypothetical protein
MRLRLGKGVGLGLPTMTQLSTTAVPDAKEMAMDQWRASMGVT